MDMTTRVENLSSADQELAPGSGFIPAKGFRDFPDAEFKDQHEKYAKSRLEADPPILKVSSTPAGAGEPAQEAGKSAAQEQTEQNAEDARRSEEQARLEQRREVESSRKHR
jgi:hypothetical protein